jgi:rubrerythrin
MIDKSLKIVLRDALDDERKAEATYAAVIDTFGPVRPFINIISAEQRHSRAIERQMDRLGMEIPPNAWAGKIGPPISLAAACEQAIAAEIENIALYDRLIPLIGDPVVATVLHNLQDASRNNHLPAFRRCLERQQSGRGKADGGRGGRGERGGRGHGGQGDCSS